MSYTEASSDYQETLPIYRQISLQGTISELWSRSPQDKPVLLRMQSMLPQFKITSEVLQDLWTLHSNEAKTSIVCTAYKYSPAHFLSLKVTEVHYISRGRNIPPADYLIYLSSQTCASSAERLKSEEKIIEKMMKSIERRITREQSIEPLDICRTLLIFAADKTSSKLQIKCEILYPSISFQFSPISSLKLVSTPLSVKLTQNKRDKFQAGYLTMDQSGRVLPLLPSDPLAYKYPIVGIWVAGIPESQNVKACPIMHPLVWANCVQYIENSSIKDKISPSLEENAFLFLHFSTKPKFYEASTVGNPCWKTSRFCSELHKEDGLFAPIYATFVREDQSSSSLEISMNLPRPAQSFTPVAVNTNYPKPPRQSVSPSNAMSNRSSDSFKHMYSPSAEKIIQEQSKMLAQLQAQILELQAHIFSSTPQNKHSNAFTPNRKSENKDFFVETPKLKKSISNASDLLNIPRPGKAKGETPRLRKSNSGSSDSFQFGKVREDSSQVYNPLRYSNKSPEPSPLPYSTKPKAENPSENTIYVPKINYDSGSESSLEDDQVEAVERKYLYQGKN